MTDGQTIYRHMVRGSAWALAMRWGLRAMGFVSIVILARLLSPEDFGVVAMASLVIAFLETSTDMGVSQLVIREPGIGRGFINTAWTFQIFIAVFNAIVLVAIAPFAAHYFDEPRVTTVIYVLAVAGIIAGASNIGMVLVRKELDFARDFRFTIYRRVIRFVVVVSAAYVMRSYWALVIGLVAGRVAGFALSYRMHVYRPRPCLTWARKFWVFSLSIIPLRIAKFLNNKAHTIVVGGLGDTGQLGNYHMAAEVSSMLTNEVVMPLGRGLFPNYAKLVQEPDRLRQVYLYVLSVIGLLCFPMGFGLSVMAQEFVAVVLGDQWVGAVPLVRWLAVYATVAAIVHLMSGQILIVSGHEKAAAILAWIRLAIFVPAIVAGASLNGAEGVAMAATGATMALVPVAAFGLKSKLALPYGQLAGALWRPLAAAGVMVAALLALDIGANVLGGWALFAEIIVGVAVYVTTLGAFWGVAGKPEGPEKIVASFAVAKLSARFRR
ncbi:MAG: oligosaccharide flippase family protein [Sphingomonadales bacterium]